MAKLPITFLTGFLGSGKTTLLSRALSQPELAKSVVIINEFGEISIDHLVVASLSENILELRGGCLCCTIREDLAMTLRDLHERRVLEKIPRFDQVIVETSGLADPIPLIHTITTNPPLQTVYALDGIVTVVDALHFDATISQHETASNQIVLADIIVLSKTDLVDDTAINRIRARVNDLNPSAKVIPVVNGEVDCTTVFGRGLFTADGTSSQTSAWFDAHQSHQHDHKDHYAGHVICNYEPLSLAGTSVFLNRVVNEQKERILRIKGIASFREKNGQPGFLHAVQDKFYPVQWLDQWPSEDHSNRLVFIGRDLDIEALETGFNSLCL